MVKRRMYRKKRLGRPKKRMLRYRRRGQLRGPLTRTFTETVRLADIPITTAAPYLDSWKVRITDIPQIADYSALYTQYKINRVQHILIPQFQTEEANQAGANSATPGLGYYGQPRIVYAIQDSPNVPVPATEQEVLEDNGCKIKTLHNVFKVSQKPVPDVAMFINGAGLTQYVRAKSMFFDFAAGAANNPLHGAIQVAITQPGFNATHTMYHYAKISFTVRDSR